MKQYIDKTVPCYKDGKDCDKRRVTSEYNCHSDCPEYKEYHDERVAKLDLINKKRSEERLVTETRIRAMNKATRRKSKQTRWKG